MTKDKLYIMVIVILILGNSLHFRKSITIHESEVDPYEGLLYDFVGEILTNNMQLQWLGEGVAINEKLILENEDSEMISLKEILEYDKKLIFRFSDMACNECIDAQMNMLKNHSASFNENDIILIASGNKRNLLIKKNEFQLPFMIYFIEYEGLHFELERMNTPYYFVIDRNIIADLVFVPAKEIPLPTINYFNMLKDRFDNTLLK
ncbi:MAG TPA: hypothetical protein VLZ83_12580 [Edaphocola sp.]|nr:hypothetical protein [Edaphocola sp.]